MHTQHSTSKAVSDHLVACLEAEGVKFVGIPGEDNIRLTDMLGTLTAAG